MVGKDTPAPKPAPKISDVEKLANRGLGNGAPAVRPQDPVTSKTVKK